MKKIAVRYQDNFQAFDSQQWKTCKGDVWAENGCAVVRAIISQPAGPGVFGFGGFGSVHKWFNPKLEGDNGIEVTLADYHQSGDFLNKWLDMYGRPSKEADPTVGRYIMGCSIIIANYHGQIGGEKEPSKDRGVQVHFDLMSKRG